MILIPLIISLKVSCKAKPKMVPAIPSPAIKPLTLTPYILRIAKAATIRIKYLVTFLKRLVMVFLFFFS